MQLLLFYITADEVKKATLIFKSKCSSLNEIPSCVFKYVADFISPILCKLFNESFQNGSFLSCFKLARVIPIHKSGSETDARKFKPLSILAFIDKVFERLIHSRV